VARLVPDRVLATIVLVIAFWALNVTIVKWALGQWLPLAYSFDRFVVGTILFAGWVLLREGSLRVQRADLPMLACAGAVGIFGNQIAFMYATTYTSATTVSLLMATAPGFAALAAWVLGHERVTRRHWIGLGVAAAGTVLVLRGSGARLDLTSLRGDLCALAMGASWALYSVLIRPLMGRYSASRISAIVLVVGTPMILPFAWSQVARQDYGSLTTGAWAAVVYSLFFSLLFTNILWFGAVHRGGAARATAVLPLQPFLGALFALLFLGERVTPLEWIGGLVIVAGIGFTRLRGSRPGPEHPPPEFALR
jgi:drug/metabolite transporter (DMT)-like permease